MVLSARMRTISSTVLLLATLQTGWALPSYEDVSAIVCAGPDTHCQRPYRCTKLVYEENSLVNHHLEDPCREHSQVCCDDDNVVMGTLPPPTHISQGCGLRFKNVFDTILEKQAQFAEFPWMVAIMREEKLEDEILQLYLCGGSLIHPSVVLTASHCVFGRPPQKLKARAGEWNTDSISEPLPHQDRSIAEFVTHEDFQSGSLANDIALVFLEHPFDIADNVRTVCLPPENTVFDFSDCFATGWGRDSKNGSYQWILKKLDLPVVPRDNCLTALRSTRLGDSFELHSSFICAGGGIGKDTCKGDGGSPLVCPIADIDDRYQQVGVVSWRIGCVEAVPGIYVGVSNMRSWIDNHLRSRKIDSSSYINIDTPY